MGDERIPMVDAEYCLICNEWIGKGNDPALCGTKICQELFDYECAFNKFANEQKEGEGDG